MKKILIFLMTLMPLSVLAQDNTWERLDDEPEVEEQKKVNPDAKYLAGAVPLVDGKVVFNTVIEAPGKSAAEIYAIVKRYMNRMAKEKNQLEISRIAVDDSASYTLGGIYQEWLVFSSKSFSLDRTKFKYNLLVKCEDGKADITIRNINYIYEEERGGGMLVAEEWITDKYCLNKKGTKLLPLSGKFRRKTIDRKDFLFNKFKSLLNDK